MSSLSLVLADDMRVVLFGLRRRLDFVSIVVVLAGRLIDSLQPPPPPPTAASLSGDRLVELSCDEDEVNEDREHVDEVRKSFGCVVDAIIGFEFSVDGFKNVDVDESAALSKFIIVVGDSEMER